MLRQMGAFLSGRVTHELMADFWPYADQDPTNPAVIADYSRIWRETPKYRLLAVSASRGLEHHGRP